MSAVLIASLALGALLLVAMGLFGVISGSVSRRRGELAVRLALGATHRGVLRLVLSEGAVLVGAGMLFGIPGIYATLGLIRGLLIDVSPWDPATLLIVTISLGIVTLAAAPAPPLRRRHRRQPAAVAAQIHHRRDFRPADDLGLIAAASGALDSVPRRPGPADRGR